MARMHSCFFLVLASTRPNRQGRRYTVVHGPHGYYFFHAVFLPWLHFKRHLCYKRVCAVAYHAGRGFRCSFRPQGLHTGVKSWGSDLGFSSFLLLSSPHAHTQHNSLCTLL